MARSITSANSVFTFSSADPVFPVLTSLEGYATDAGFSSSKVTSAMAEIGIDGLMSAGFVFDTVKVMITLQADSPSKGFFDDWYAAMQSQRETVFVDAVLTLPATGDSYTYTRGVLTGYAAAPTGKKVLSPVEYEITFNTITHGGI